ncbi:hypothetical protein [Isoptericola variabilis]|nr:hypothetical protein [Isoptericola variabilis]TWH25811.1 hypothetical protein L600_000900000610 [Isoptericola variabilis J7]
MNQLWGPALEAELEYRRERAARSYGAPGPWTRLRARLATRRRDAVRRVEARPEATARRAAQIEGALDALRLERLARRAA